MNISEVVLIPGGHLLQEDDEDPEENSCFSGGICDLSRWLFGEDSSTQTNHILTRKLAHHLVNNNNNNNRSLPMLKGTSESCPTG